MQETSKENTGLIIGIVVATVLIFAGFAFLLLRMPGDQRSLPSDKTGVDENVVFNDVNDPSVGAADAKVVVHIEGDFQCPACRSAEVGVTAAREKYADRVRFVWKDFPLTQIHQHAREAANAARCAADQGWFWKFHDLLYERQDAWVAQSNPADYFTAYARELGAKEADFRSCYDVKINDAKVMANYQEGLSNNVDRTPTFFVNRKRYFGMSPEEWTVVLDKALAEATAPAKP